MFGVFRQSTNIPSFQAFLLYLYTDDIEFASFGSKANRKTRAAEMVSLAPNCVPRPSPKSIYRLADKVSSLTSYCKTFRLTVATQYDVPALKSIALREIKEALEQCDAIRETFGRFASHYPEILRMHVENLASILIKVDSEEVQGQLNERLQAFSEGEIDHASEAFSSLWRTLTCGGGDRGDETTRNTRQDTERFSFSPIFVPAQDLPLKMALIKSIRQGSFCDRRYLAKREHTGKWRAPVYISSIVLDEIEPALNTRGQMSHRYAALSLGFSAAIEEKRRNPRAETTASTSSAGHTLQCPNPDCLQRGVLLFVREIGTKTTKLQWLQERVELASRYEEEYPRSS
ncbi:hypothetical protein BDM02DRAFT_3264538 [Thelephora ganbajun]|uniref:Uncharacterized protein n=1 Tax=Thelephora ganbajun TaxID=370292 RepID=A0ACB6YYS7_THEGA|nr:hypothetical protein BDM02DRAFT_3264538 [Thelephora ganbajun]